MPGNISSIILLKIEMSWPTSLGMLIRYSEFTIIYYSLRPRIFFFSWPHRIMMDLMDRIPKS